MHTKERTVQASGAYPPERAAAVGRITGRKPSKTDKAADGNPAAGFLGTVFHPIPATRLNPLFNRKNYGFLYESARNYSDLLGSSFDLMPDEKDFTGLFRYFESLLPEGQQLLLTEENKRLSFKIWFGYDFLIGEVFFIPIQILDKTKGAFRDILLSFFQHFCRTHHFPKKESLYDYEMIVDGYLEGWCGQDSDPGIRDYLAAYQKGYIDDTFSLVYQPVHSIAELEGMIKGYMPKGKREKKLITSIRQGIGILRTNKNIFSYARRPAEDDDNFYGIDEDDRIIEAERLLRFVYSGNDYVSGSLLEYINMESQDNANDYFPRNSLILSPDTDRLLEADFVERFFTWLEEFINILYDYEA
ncbi:MAG: hypothetical protein LBS20_17595 [Prevotella sp.]|jgi:hypothetical protein|nr:hypothetical protein [Prevotella sp.]